MTSNGDESDLDGTQAQNAVASLSRTLSIIGIVFGVETIIVNVFALWFFHRTSSFKNKHTMLIMIKIFSDIPSVCILTFWFLPWAFFFTTMGEGTRHWFRYPHVIFSTISEFTSYFALNMQIHILVARFIGVFYTFAFNRIFRRKYIILIFGFNILLASNAVGLTSFYFGGILYYLPGYFLATAVKLTNLDESAEIPTAAGIVIIVQVWVLIGICLSLAIATVIKLRKLNNAQTPGMTDKVREKRRSAEWKLLVISIASPLILLIQATGVMLAHFVVSGKDFAEVIIYCFFITCVSELIQAQSYAIVQLAINESFWRFIKRQPKQNITSGTIGSTKITHS